MEHPIVETGFALVATLKSVAAANPVFMSTAEQGDRVDRRWPRSRRQVAELKLRVLACAQDVAETTAARDAGDWLAHATRSRPEDTRADLGWRSRWTAATPCSVTRCGTGPRTWPRRRSSPVPWTACRVRSPPRSWGWRRSGWSAMRAEFGPRQLARLGRRILDVVAPEIADAAEAKRLAALEAAAHRKTRLSLRRVGDGTTRITGLLPDAAATRLATYLEAFTNPRKDPEGRGPVLTQAGDPLDRLPYPRRLGEAFLHLLEVVDPKRLPVHGGDATTLLITMPLEHSAPGWAPRRSSAPPTSPATTTAATSPPPKPAAWPATRTSSPRSSAGSRRSWTKAAPSGCSPEPSTRP